jgi:hypothetical protein
MMKQLIIIHPSGAVDITMLKAHPTTEQLQKAVGGYIEVVPQFITYDGNPCLVFCNEEGKLHGLPFNPFATKAWSKAIGQDVIRLGDLLVGDIAIVMGPQSWLRAM